MANCSDNISWRYIKILLSPLDAVIMLNLCFYFITEICLVAMVIWPEFLQILSLCSINEWRSKFWQTDVQKKQILQNIFFTLPFSRNLLNIQGILSLFIYQLKLQILEKKLVSKPCRPCLGCSFRWCRLIRATLFPSFEDSFIWCQNV